MGFFDFKHEHKLDKSTKLEIIKLKNVKIEHSFDPTKTEEKISLLISELILRASMFLLAVFYIYISSGSLSLLLRGELPKGAIYFGTFSSIVYFALYFTIEVIIPLSTQKPKKIDSRIRIVIFVIFCILGFYLKSNIFTDSVNPASHGTKNIEMITPAQPATIQSPVTIQPAVAQNIPTHDIVVHNNSTKSNPMTLRYDVPQWVSRLVLIIVPITMFLLHISLMAGLSGNGDDKNTRTGIKITVALQYLSVAFFAYLFNQPYFLLMLLTYHVAIYLFSIFFWFAPLIMIFIFLVIAGFVSLIKG